MRKALEVLVLFVGICSAVPARAGDVAPVKCGPNQDRVWVYDSLTTFDLQSKIRCGETVEIVGRVKGFVKVRTQDGSEGYIPDSALPNVSPQEDSGGKPADVNAAAAAATLGRIARGVAARPAAAAVPPANVQPAPSITKSVSTVASVGAMHPTPSNRRAVATASAMSAFNLNAKSTSSASSRAIPTGAKSNTPQPPAKILHPNPPASDLAPALLIPAPAINTMTAMNFPVASLAPETPNTLPASASVDSDEFPGLQLVNDSADPACLSFFSAYGLAPSQLKWIAQNRKKRFPSICPAPDPSKVDFVVIFTHDVNVYDSALPVPVHTDRNGFSDFSPMVGVDTALMSQSAADKAKYEFVWVFLMKRGSFDPATFSPRRRYQFTRVESNSFGSKAGVKTIEDAFQFVALQGPSH
jgi:hypothetical protein